MLKNIKLIEIIDQIQQKQYRFSKALYRVTKKRNINRYIERYIIRHIVIYVEISRCNDVATHQNNVSM